MFLQTLGSLILVLGISYHLVTASWQVVLLSFVVAGVGYATWKLRKAIIRRAKIKALWKRSIEIDEMLDIMEREQRAQAERLRSAVASTPSSAERRRTGKTCVALQGPAKSSPVQTGSFDRETLLATDIVGEAPWRAQVNSSVDPKTRIYKFSMKELANSREQKVQPQLQV